MFYYFTHGINNNMIIAKLLSVTNVFISLLNLCDYKILSTNYTSILKTLEI